MKRISNYDLLSKASHKPFGIIDYWFRVGTFGLKEGRVKKTLAWKRYDNADRRKACKELEKAF